MFKLSILIPTYNRSKFLLKNLDQLANTITNNNLQDEVEIIVSNNQSTDETHDEVNNFKINNSHLSINYFLQDSNIGLEKNALFVLKKAKGEFVMYLGDDDYLHSLYLIEVINRIKSVDSLTCILPAIKAIRPDGTATGYYRDKNLNTTYHTGGFKNCLVNSWRGHQLSGLVFKREGLFEEYDSQSVSNIYPFIFFVSICTLKGVTINLIEFPINVTEVPQNKKDWDYTIDGLIGDIFDNYKKLPISYFKRNILQMAFLKIQKGRYLKYVSKKKYILFYKSISSIIVNDSTLLITKVMTPFITHYMLVNWMIRKVASKI